MLVGVRLFEVFHSLVKTPNRAFTELCRVPFLRVFDMATAGATVNVFSQDKLLIIHSILCNHILYFNLQMCRRSSVIEVENRCCEYVDIGFALGEVVDKGRCYKMWK